MTQSLHLFLNLCCTCSGGRLAADMILVCASLATPGLAGGNMLLMHIQLSERIIWCLLLHKLHLIVHDQGATPLVVQQLPLGQGSHQDSIWS